MSLLPVAMMQGSEDNMKEGQSHQEAKSEYEKEDYMGVNQILVYTFKKQKPTYYVPAYLRMKINRVNKIDYLESLA